MDFLIALDEQHEERDDDQQADDQAHLEDISRECSEYWIFFKLDLQLVSFETFDYAGLDFGIAIDDQRGLAARDRFRPLRDTGVAERRRPRVADDRPGIVPLPRL